MDFPELIVGEAGAAVEFFGKASSPFMHTSGQTMLKCIGKQAKIDQNMPCASRVMLK